ncbi:MAG: hypothetical protein N3F66_14900 [Spirochaetes bacterium]|nr:hypothetical protein [Spirochaetota bacterium]
MLSSDYSEMVAEYIEAGVGSIRICPKSGLLSNVSKNTLKKCDYFDVNPLFLFLEEKPNDNNQA